MSSYLNTHFRSFDTHASQLIKNNKLNNCNITRCEICHNKHLCNPNNSINNTSIAAVWRPILYEKQPFPDNYTDPIQFLSSITTNKYSAQLSASNDNSYLNLFVHTLVITQRITILTVIASLYYLLYMQQLTLHNLLYIDALNIITGCGFYIAINFGQSKTFSILNFCYSIIQRLSVFISILFLLSPILRSLTSSYSSDSIWSLSLFLGLFHLATHDYAHINNNNIDQSNTVITTNPNGNNTASLNTVILSSILLASRLNDSMVVFAFLLLSFELNGILPILQHEIRLFSLKLHILTTLIYCALGTIILALYIKSNILLLLFLISNFFVQFICPAWFLWVQQFKQEIRGPWDYDDEREVSQGNL
jgi:phosphatidylinositol glycan class C protein